MSFEETKKKLKNDIHDNLQIKFDELSKQLLTEDISLKTKFGENSVNLNLEYNNSKIHIDIENYNEKKIIEELFFLMDHIITNTTKKARVMYPRFYLQLLRQTVADKDTNDVDKLINKFKTKIKVIKK